MVLVVAIEELVFRGFFPGALSKKIGVWPAIVLSSLLWGVSHLGSMAYEGLTFGFMIIGIASFLVWGITLSLCFLIAEESLWFPYGLHLGVNLGFSMAGWFFLIQPTAPPWLIGHPAWSPESGLIGPVVWLIVALIAYRLTDKEKMAGLAEA
jgi:membrane protease YdiL (CAAX protease family)